MFGVGAMLVSRDHRLQRVLASRVFLFVAGFAFFATLMVSRWYLLPQLTGEILVGAGFVLLVPCLLHVRPASAPYAKTACFLATISYTLYLVHFPFMACLVALSIAGTQYLWSATGILIFSVMACLTLANAYLVYRLFEARTEVLRTWMLGLVTGR